MLWVRTEPTPDGTAYMVVIETADDHAFTLDRTDALEYAASVTAIAARAEYEAAVVAQLRAADTPHEGIAEIVWGLRARRTPIAFPTGIEFAAGVNADADPFIRVDVDGTAPGQIAPAAARGHAQAVLDALEVAQLDADYLEHLVVAVGVDEPTARHVVEDLATHRPEVA